MKANKGLHGGVNEIMRGRQGISGMYHILVDDVKYGLFFEFGDGATGLIEVSLQSQGFAPSEYDKALKKTWQAVHKSIEAKYGEAALKGGFPAKNTIGEGGVMSSGIWKTPKGEIYLGIGEIGGEYSCVVKTQMTSFLGN